MYTSSGGVGNLGNGSVVALYPNGSTAVVFSNGAHCSPCVCLRLVAGGLAAHGTGERVWSRGGPLPPRAHAARGTSVDAPPSQGVAVDSKNVLYVYESNRETVYAVKGGVQTPLATSVGGGYSYLAVAPAGDAVFVANRNYDKLQRVSLATGAVSSVADVISPFGLCFGPQARAPTAMAVLRCGAVHVSLD